ncbi:endonuclease/exonuclease/phosphatase family protein [Streptomyces sp. NPDC058751]|uniref:endonuclease/exonuclease/phosphatase family protein n=1 Tax=Streptomyces sp. NPDC058751 TaxID=3346623 RepID=UPI0036B277E0
MGEPDTGAAVKRAALRAALGAARWWPASGRARDRSPWTRGRLLAASAVLTAVLTTFHRLVPNTPGHLGSLLESFLPWSGLLVVPLLGMALLRRSALALVALFLPVAAWTYRFGGLLLPEAEPGTHDLVVVQHNAGDENPDPAGTARSLAAAEPDLIALEELLPAALPVYERTLAPRYPYHAVRGTVGLWSKHPLTDVRKAHIKPAGITEPWSRGLRGVVHARDREIAVYVAHLPSVRVHATGLASARRDESARLLGRAVAAEKLPTVILLGDLNSTVDDRGLTPLSSRMNVPARGFAFTFPAAFPLARIDQVMARSATVGHLRPLPRTGSDHLPVIARITLD